MFHLRRKVATVCFFRSRATSASQAGAWGAEWPEHTTMKTGRERPLTQNVTTATKKQVWYQAV